MRRHCGQFTDDLACPVCSEWLDGQEARLVDILAALEGSRTEQGTRRCRIGRWLDSIGDDTAGKPDLVATLETSDPHGEHYRRLDALDALTHTLGLQTSIKSIGDHRARRCRCYH